MTSPLRFLLAPLMALAAVLVLVLPAAASAAPAGDLQATLTATGGTTVRLELRNDGATTAYVPTWLTGARGISSPILTVAHDGAPVAYTGMLAKRDEAAGADDLALAPGASLAWTVDVATAYAVPAGTSTVAYEATTPEGVSITSNTVAISASRPAPRPYAAAPSGIGAAAITFTGCSDAERAQINTAVAAANTYAQYANAYLAAGGQGMRYTHWFGTYLSARWTSVQSHYAAIQAVTGGSSLAFTCHDAGCNDPGGGTYAFVYSSSPYMVYLCEVFWSAANTGTDSRAGTLIHEISHFTVVAGTYDFQYGQSAAQALAISNPAQAVSNADNHEYFAEDNPVAQNYSTYANPAASYNLGTTAQGSSSSATQITITSAGTTALHPAGVSVTGDYLVTTDTCTGATLAQGATCHLDVVFVPSTTGTRNGSVALLGATISPTAISLTGIGTAAPVPVIAPDPTPAATPAAAPAATPAAPLALKAASSCKATGGCAVTGTVPAGATAVTVRATRKGGSARGACKVTGTRYACALRLGKGTWTVVTEATGPGGVVARSSKKVVR